MSIFAIDRRAQIEVVTSTEHDNAIVIIYGEALQSLVIPVTEYQHNDNVATIVGQVLFRGLKAAGVSVSGRRAHVDDHNNVKASFDLFFFPGLESEAGGKS